MKVNKTKTNSQVRIFVYCIVLVLLSVFVLLYVKKLRVAKSPGYKDYLDQQRRYTSLVGVIKSGESLNISYCAQGLYLETDDSKTILIKMKGSDDEISMYDDKNLVGKRVRVEAIYPVAEIFCQALICNCEDYLLAKSIVPL